MSYYYQPGSLPPTQPPAVEANKPPMYAAQTVPPTAAAAPRIPGAAAYPQHSSLPPGGGLIRPAVVSPGIPRPIAVSLPPSYQSSSYPGSNVYPSGAHGGLYASSALAYAAKPHLAAQQGSTQPPVAPAAVPAPAPQTNPYLGAATVPGSRYPAANPTAYTGTHIITTSAVAGGVYSHHAAAAGYQPSSSAIKPYPPATPSARPASLYQPQQAVTPLAMSSYQPLQPQHHQPGTGPPPLMGAAPPAQYQPGQVSPLYVRPM